MRQLRTRYVLLFVLSVKAALAQTYGFAPTTGSTVSVYDAETLTETGAVGAPGPATILAAAHRSHALYIADPCCSTDLGFLVKGNATSEQTVRSFPGVWASHIAAMIVSPDGDTLYVQGASLEVVDLRTGKVVATVPTAGNGSFGATAFQFSRDGKRMYAFESYIVNGGPPDSPILSYVQVIDTTTYALIATIGTPGTQTSFSISSDEKTGWFLDFNGNVLEVDLQSGATINTIPDQARSIALTEDGSQVITVGPNVTFISAATGTITKQLPLPSPLAFSSYIGVNRSSAFALYLDSSALPHLLKIDLSTDEVTNRVDPVSEVTSLAMGAGGTEIYLSHGSQTEVSVIDAVNHKVAGTLESTGYPLRNVVSPDGSEVFIAEESVNQVTRASGSFPFLRIASTTLPVVGEGIGAYGALAISHDGSTLYASQVSGGDRDR